MSGNLVLHSGGLDSTLVLYQALRNGQNTIALSFDYGQRNDYELKAQVDTCEFFFRQGYRFKREIHNIEGIFAGSGSELLRLGAPTSEWTPEQVTSFRGEAPSSVPFRNGVLISLGVTQALIEDCDKLYIGITGQGSDQYADCSPQFVAAMSQAVKFGTGGKVELVAPFADRTKEQIVAYAVRHAEDLPLAYTWTCYSDNNGLHCGKCLSCVERQQAFDKLGAKDPVLYSLDMNDGGVPAKQLHQGTHTGFNPRKTGP
jgi:7-cyano-7-deazaguanine synthase